jgi:hypothetical protein
MFGLGLSPVLACLPVEAAISNALLLFRYPATPVAQKLPIRNAAGVTPSELGDTRKSGIRADFST